MKKDMQQPILYQETRTETLKSFNRLVNAFIFFKIMSPGGFPNQITTPVRFIYFPHAPYGVWLNSGRILEFNQNVPQKSTQKVHFNHTTQNELVTESRTLVWK